MDFRKFSKFSESKIVKYEIRTTQLSDSGNYSCTVENKYGTSKQYAWYEIMALPLSITIPNGRPYVAEENQPEFIIPCIVQSQSKVRQFQIKWFLNDTEILPDGKIYNVSSPSFQFGFFHDSFVYYIRKNRINIVQMATLMTVVISKLL